MRHDEGGKSASEKNDLPELGWPRRVAKSWGWSLVLFVVWLALFGNAVRYMTFGVTIGRAVFLVITAAFVVGSAVGTVRKLRARNAPPG
jgi:hypothetical protein